MPKKGNNIFIGVLRYLLNPVLFISIMGPVLMENNLDLLNGHNTDYAGNNKFQELLSNEYNYALNSFNIQLFVLILSIVFTIIETLRAFYRLGHDYSIERVKKAISNSAFTCIILIASFFLVGLFIIALMSGSFASERLISLYLKDSEKPLFNLLGVNMFLPPIESLITKWRVFIIVYAILFLIWENNTLPKIAQKLKAAAKNENDK